MISKEEFVKALDEIVEFENKLDKLRGVSTDLSLSFSDIGGMLVQSLIRVLCLSCGLNPDEKYGDDISWWVYETDCGKDKKMNVVEYKKKKYHIDTPSDLYDFINFVRENQQF